MSDRKPEAPVEEAARDSEVDRSRAAGPLDLRKYTQQIWLAGLGAFARAEQEGSRFFDTLVDLGRDLEGRTRDHTEARVEELKERVRTRTGETMEKMEKAFDERLTRALSRLGLPNRREVESLRRRVQELSAALEAARRKEDASTDDAESSSRQDQL